MSTNLKVSILIPSYNAAQWIEATVQSCLEQSYPNCEVIVIDDGSTDDSPQRLAKFADRATIRCRANRGGNPTRNELLSLASGDWIQFLDADDALLPPKIEHQIACLADFPEADVFYSPQRIEHHTGPAVDTTLADPHDPNGDHDPWAYHLAWHLTQTGGALFKADTLRAVGAWNEAMPCCQDNELFHRLLKANARFVRCPHADSIYRRFADGSVSTRQPERLVRVMLDLLADGEAFLRAQNALSQRRLNALNDTRLRLARNLFPFDAKKARAIHATIRASDPHFQPAPAPHAPKSYRIAYRLLGFHLAESLAATLRKP